MSLHGNPKVPEFGQPVLNLDRFGLPKDFATYMWVVYGRRVPDRSPVRLSFLQRCQPRRPNPTVPSMR